jgi:hypothetical protein
VSPTYVHTHKKKNGRVYRYFRGPRSSVATHRPRLSEDLETAQRQAQAVLNFGEMSARRVSAKLLANTQVRARRRGLSCDLTVPGIVQMLEDQHYCCAISGLPFDLAWAKGRDLFRNPYAPSIDRKQSKQGYTAANCRLVLSAINYGMNEWGEDVYLTIAAAAVKHARKASRKGGDACR